MFLKISQNSQENTCARVSFLIKLQAYFDHSDTCYHTVSFLCKLPKYCYYFRYDYNIILLGFSDVFLELYLLTTALVLKSVLRFHIITAIINTLNEKWRNGERGMHLGMLQRMSGEIPRKHLEEYFGEYLGERLGGCLRERLREFLTLCEKYPNTEFFLVRIFLYSD